MKKLTLVLSMLIALVGFNANAAMYIVGSNPFGNWNPGNGVEMTDNGDGTYSYTATITGTVYFVFGDGLNSDWGVFNPDHRYGPATGDENVAVDEWVATQKAGDHGSYIFTGSGDDYTFTFDEINSQFKIEGYVEPINPLTGHLYALGQVNGNNWNPSTGIEMNTTDENIFTLTEAEITDSGEGFGFFSFTSKLGENADDWGFQPYRRGAAADGTLVEDGVVAELANWGSTGAFKVVPGIYDIEVNLSENTVLLTRKGGDVPPVEITVYTVAGPDIIFGSNWDPTDEANDMVKGADGIYTWSKDEVALYGNFEFKVAGNHDFKVYEWPLGNNWIAKVNEEGIYTIEITFDPEAEDADRITCTLTKTGDVEHVDHTYTVAGTENVFGSNWNPEDEANDMEKGADGIYTWSKDDVELAAQEEVQFRIVQDHAWTYAWPVGNWRYTCEEAGTYNIVITFDPTAIDEEKITFTATPAGEPTFIRGDVDNSGDVKIGDVTALINYLLSGDATGVNLQGADCDNSGDVKIGDVTALINYLLSGSWAD